MQKFFTALISIFFLISASCTSNIFREMSGMTWGTTYHIVYESSENLDSLIHEEMRKIDESLSMFNPESNVSRINSGQDSVADTFFLQVFRISQHVAKESGGRFDPTVRPLVDLWGFGAKRKEALTPPSNSDIASAISSVGISECSISRDGVVHKKHPDTSFDFSAIAKGFGVDCIANLFELHGVTNYMIEIGGEIVLSGHNARGEQWAIQIDSPMSGADNHVALKVERFGPERTAIATSGNYRNFHTDAQGHKYGHTISPLTGKPVQTDVLSATVIDRNGSCAVADAFATACMGLSKAEAQALLKRNGLEGLIVP